MNSSDPSKPPSEKPSLSDKLKSVMKKEHIDNFVDYTRVHTREMSAFALLLLGLFFLFIFPFLGQAFVGIVIAVFFGKEITEVFLHYDRYIAQWGIPRSIVLAGAALAFFIEAPAIFIAIAFTLGLKHLFEAGSSST